MSQSLEYDDILRYRLQYMKHIPSFFHLDVMYRVINRNIPHNTMTHESMMK